MWGWLGLVGSRIGGSWGSRIGGSWGRGIMGESNRGIMVSETVWNPPLLHII
jgi:hypothetical protein